MTAKYDFKDNGHNIVVDGGWTCVVLTGIFEIMIQKFPYRRIKRTMNRELVNSVERRTW